MVANIWVAAADNQVDVVKSYLDSGKFSANSKDPNGYTAIHAAASYGHIDLLKLLILSGGDINIQDNEGDTPLHHVEDLATATVMVEELGADYKKKNTEGQTPAEYIEEDGDFPELAQYLRSLMHDQPQSSVLGDLPSPGNVEGHQIRYIMEEDQEEMSEERRKQLEEIANSDNPEEALRRLVTSAVREGLANYKAASDEPEAKRARE
ncbi:CIC11C00000002818 [Sungouiella intermedia]|uniref:CIC11C00000002818 n=1 Tax=Sungouiella intermedia TaxID=45354 RepID=A0A1L0D609_9ASCO|nr:CIC11C00000002818 [[Candida] intermedia]